MNEIIIGMIAGGVGGGIRTIVTAVNGFASGRRLSKSNLQNFLFYFISFILTGALAGLIFGPGKVLAFVMGFAGIDLLDTYYKAIMKKDINIKEQKKSK